MTAQKRETGKNYIELLNDEATEAQTGNVSPAAQRVKNYVLELVASVLN